MRHSQRSMDCSICLKHRDVRKQTLLSVCREEGSLVSKSVFQKHGFPGHCAVITTAFTLRKYEADFKVCAKVNITVVDVTH